MARVVGSGYRHGRRPRSGSRTAPHAPAPAHRVVAAGTTCTGLNCDLPAVWAQRGHRDAVVVLDTNSEAAVAEPTAAATASPAPLPTPSIRYSANRLAQVAGGSLGAAPIGIIPGIPALDAQAAVLVDMGRREVLYVKNHHLSRPMASTAKIVTAIVALEHAPLNHDHRGGCGGGGRNEARRKPHGLAGR